jgi:hypothetical protein
VAKGPGLWLSRPLNRLITMMFVVHFTATGCKPCAWVFFSVPTTGLVNAGQCHRNNVGHCAAGRVLWVLCRTPGGKHVLLPIGPKSVTTKLDWGSLQGIVLMSS